MKNIFRLVALSAVLMVFASCQKSPEMSQANGYLSFGEFSLQVDETVVTKADPAGDNYAINIYDADEKLVVATTYGQVSENNMITLPAGTYTLEARSLSGDIPMASWENPIYGTSKQFTIQAGEKTEVGALVCTLLQCKVTVSYNDEFLKNVTGPGKTTVEVTAGHPLEYALNADATYDQSAGFFSVGEGSTMTVVFSGSIKGKSESMRKTFTNISAKQWRQVKFIQKKNDQGQATFDIVINDLISDEILNDDINASEDILGEDPDAPKGDGGITLDFDYEAGCDEQLTDLQNMLIVPSSERNMSIKLKAVVPNGILKFSVAIESDSDAFKLALAAANAFNLDLINPLPEHDVIFQVVPFPHGAELSGKTEVAFDLSAAQSAITAYPGTHSFKMTIVDNTFCTKVIPVVMVVE